MPTPPEIEQTQPAEVSAIIEAQCFLVNSPNVIHETIDGEVVVLNLATGAYYSLERSGAEIWGLLCAGCAPAAVIAVLSGRYGGGAGIEHAVRQFVLELCQEDLIVAAPAGETQPISESQAQTLSAELEANFETPVLQKFTDMKDFLLLDPIHEVDDTGWPNPESLPPA